jgi:hypothetical protein
MIDRRMRKIGGEGRGKRGGRRSGMILHPEDPGAKV